MSPRATRCVRQPRDRGQAPRGRTNGDPAGRRRSARRALGRLAGQRPVDRRRQPLRRAPAVRSASPAFAWMRSSLPTPARLLRRTSCSGPRLRSPLLSVGIRASPSSTDQTPQARAPAWRGRRRRSPDRGTRRRVSCLTPALPRRADRREGASCFGRNPSCRSTQHRLGIAPQRRTSASRGQVAPCPAQARRSEQSHEVEAHVAVSSADHVPKPPRQVRLPGLRRGHLPRRSRWRHGGCAGGIGRDRRPAYAPSALDARATGGTGRGGWRATARVADRSPPDAPFSAGSKASS
jgi:hypothetical protein